MARTSAADSLKHQQEAIDLVAINGGLNKAAAASGIPRATLQERFHLALKNNLKARVAGPGLGDAQALRTEVTSLRAQLREAQENEIDKVTRELLEGFVASEPNPPNWLVKLKYKGGTPGVPSVLWSDWHWGERIDQSQINGINKYNIAIANERVRRLVDRTLNLLFKYTVNPNFPGIVVNLGGDMVSGDIHEELSATNEMEIMPTCLNITDAIAWALEQLAAKFDKVAVFCVTGNHGRNTKKMRAKGRHHTSFDWLIYKMLEKYFRNDKRISFVIADGPDVLYKVYEHRYLLTHGDQFRGGDGMIGALGPIIRGDHKKRSRNGAIDMEYDTMLIGHWHQYLPLDRITVNGSLCGYNEYAYSGNFGFEEPRQALWITHPNYGMTFRNPVYVDDKIAPRTANWVQVAK